MWRDKTVVARGFLKEFSATFWSFTQIHWIPLPKAPIYYIVIKQLQAESKTSIVRALSYALVRHEHVCSLEASCTSTFRKVTRVTIIPNHSSLGSAPNLWTWQWFQGSPLDSLYCLQSWWFHRRVQKNTLAPSSSRLRESWACWLNGLLIIASFLLVFRSPF